MSAYKLLLGKKWVCVINDKAFFSSKLFSESEFFKQRSVLQDCSWSSSAKFCFIYDEITHAGKFYIFNYFPIQWFSHGNDIDL